MCGRFGISQQEHELETAFNAEFYTDEVRERYNPDYDIRPSNDVPIITTEDSGHIHLAHWGFKGKIFNPKTKNTVEKLFINARGETIDEKKSFKGPWQQGQRCIFLMSRFYEWMATSKGKIPFAIQLKSGEPFAVAGIYKMQEIDEVEQMVATLITTTGNQLLHLVHNNGNNKHRMPAMLTSEEWLKWTDIALPPAEAKAMIDSFPDDALQAYPVDKSLKQPIGADFEEKAELAEAAEEHGFELLEA